MTIEELLRPFDLSPRQRNEMFIAYDESPKGFERVCRKAAGLTNPPAALTAMIRSGQHQKIETTIDVVVEAYDLEGVVNDALRLYNARTTKYPPSDDPGWTEADAIIYAADTARQNHSRFSVEDIERGLRIRLGRPWTADQDPALHKPGGSPPELLENILNKVGRIGAMPNNKSEAQILAERLRLKGASNAPDPVTTKPKVNTTDLAKRLLATLNEGKAA